MSLCRLCTNYANSKQSLRIFAKRNQKILEDIKELTGILLQNFMGLPDLVCEDCQLEIQRIMHFRNRCFQAQIHLMESVTSEQLELIPESYRIRIQSATIVAEPLCIEESLTQQEEKSETMSGETKINEEAEFDIKLDSNFHRDIVIEEVKIEDADIDCAEDLVYQSEEELDLINDDTTKEQTLEGKPGRINMSKLLFICEECGNHISGRKAFDLHCRRHRGDKQFECEICQKAFCTTSEVKRHMRKHTGERPFACQYCGRCFTDYSTRRNHERTHTNERPHVCSDCGKAFTTAYILKNHMLVHSGKRDFRCNLCDKSFLRDTHLTTHYRSHVHKRNLERQKSGCFGYEIVCT